VDTNETRPFPKQIMPQTDARLDSSLTAAARSSRSILGTQILRLAVRVCGTVTLARLVSPRDYGVFGMAAAVHGLAYVFQDFGLATVTLRKHDLTDDDRNTLFWLNLALGGVLTLAVGAAGFAAAAFFREPGLRVLLPVMGVTFLINGGHTQMRAQLAREHRFTDLNHIEIGAFTFSTAAAVAAAWLGGGAWALATMLITAEMALAAGAWRKQSWRPGPLPRTMEAFAFLPTGASLSANDGLRYVQRNIDQFVVGRWLGAGALGVYGRATQVATLPMVYVADPLGSLAVSTLRHLSGAAEGARAFWRRMLNDLAWVTLPAAVIFACVPGDLLQVLLGSRWVSGSGVLLGLAVGMALLPVQMCCGWLFLATGGSRRLLISSSVNCSAVTLTCVLMRNAGAGELALGVGLANVACAGASLALIRSTDPVSPADALSALARPLAAAAALAAAMVLALRLCWLAGALPRLCVSAGASFAWMGAVWFLWPRARAELREHFLWARR
jgi:O-antigen/teichoic acid export membrane protein